MTPLARFFWPCLLWWPVALIASSSSNDNNKRIQPYELWEPAEIKETLLKWAEHYSDFVQVTTAQEAYGLGTAGDQDDCPYDDAVPGCLNYILVLQDFEKNPKLLPQVLWSGEVHGNEQVGPTAVMEAANLLLWATACESHPRQNTTAEWARAAACRSELREFGVDDTHRRWLARLLATRRIVVVPTANAVGYYRAERVEEGIDPNRDFPYDVTDPAACMQTIAGRTLNEVFREHMFQLSLTFHGGMRVVGYEWGAPTWDGYASPDDVAQEGIGAAYSRFGGGFSGTPAYPFGNMNQMVYAVNGGMEDWAYAASWDPKRVVPCEPKTHGGYPKEKTIYDNSTLRAFNMLVETSNRKRPKSHLGTSENVLDVAGGTGNGHVSRNIRLALLAAELVEPYLTITKVHGLPLRDDIVPLSTDEDCQTTRAFQAPPSTVVVEWSVGGALTIDDTQLWYAEWKDIPASLLDCESQPPSVSQLEALMHVATSLSATNGTTVFAGADEAPVFSAQLDLSTFALHDRIAVIAVAKVDQDWKQQPNDVAPKIPPQSHIVNARTNPDWYHETEGSIIRGRLQWFSLPLTLQIVHRNDMVAPIQERFPLEAETAEYANQPTRKNDPLDVPTTANAGSPGISFLSVVGILSVVGLLIFVVRRAHSQSRAAHRSRLREFIQDESAVSPGLRGKQPETAENGYSDHVDDDEIGEVEMGRYAD